jgi:cytochrome c
MKTSIAAVVFLTASLIVTSAQAQSGNAARGERTFNQQCKACHTVEQGGPSPIGPNLHGLVGRKAGAVAGYEYSPAMAKSGITWDDKALADYLKDPKARVPEGKMEYAGLKQQTQLDDVIAYLQKATQ